MIEILEETDAMVSIIYHTSKSGFTTEFYIGSRTGMPLCSRYETPLTSITGIPNPSDKAGPIKKATASVVQGCRFTSDDITKLCMAALKGSAIAREILDLIPDKPLSCKRK